MARHFAFRTPAQSQARLRQFGRCAHCGDNLNDVEEHAHHVIPNQSGNPKNPDHAFLATADNCVVLCHVCHEAVHQGGKYRNGAVAPPDYFPHSHGHNRPEHQRWARLMAARARQVW